MAKAKSAANTYEEARKQRVEENRKRFESLGIAKISTSFTKLANSTKKAQQRPLRPRERTIYNIEPRRSSRVRNNVASYRDDLEIELPRNLRKSRSNSSWASYIARPLHECKTACYEDRAQAFKVAEEFQSHLQSGNPSFIKSMVRSHVYSCFWLGLPAKFCVDRLSEATVEMVLEDEKGQEYDATYIGKRSGLSGGWRAFALDHKLDDGDALVFELVEPNRFKVYMFRVSSPQSEEHDGMRYIDEEECNGHAKRKTRQQDKKDKSGDTIGRPKQAESIEGKKRRVNSRPKNKGSLKLLRKKA